ncbi:U11/U12 small nuclear ribonucleoprotein 25 kDa protein isoform 2-T2 [Discoglossus pictus]
MDVKEEAEYKADPSEDPPEYKEEEDADEELPHAEVTLEEINSQIALEFGQAMTVRVCKADGEVMPIVVVQNATVLDLKGGIQRYVQLKHQREGGIEHISWKYVWRTFNLSFAGEKLDDDNKTLRECGIKNRDEVVFIKKLKKK